MRFLVNEIYERKSQEKLSVKDKKLIQLLIQNGRSSISELSKKVEISKPAIVQKIKSLKDRKILLQPVTYTKVSIFDESFYLFEISTQVGLDTKETNSNLLSIKEISAVLWYSGNFNLLLGVNTLDPQIVLEEIEKILVVNKFRIRKCTDNWFHPPQIFKEIKNVNARFNRNKFKIDEINKRIINCLNDDPRISLVELSDNVKISVVNAKNRLNKMIKDGSIIGFSNYVDIWSCGVDVVSLSLSIKGRENSDKIIQKILSLPQTSNVWEFDHEWNVNCVFWVNSLSEVDKIINDLKKDFSGINEIESMVLLRMIGK